MKLFSPRSSPSSLRVFTACLLSFLIFMTPLTALAARTKSVTSADPANTKSQPATEQGDAFQHSFSTFFNPLAPVVNPVTTTMAATFPDPNTDGLADKGETITYTATITNITGNQINGVEFQDTPDLNTTLVGGSIHASPVAFDHAYNWVGNTQLDTSARGLPSITSDAVAPTDSFTLNTTPASGPSHGSVTISSNGHFVYTPNLGYTGDDTFTYTIKNTVDNTLMSTGMVTVHLPVCVWYLQAGASGDGRSNTPSGNPSTVSGLANQATDIFYVFSNAGTLNGSFTLNDSQQLLGQGVNLVANGITLFMAGSTPTIGNTGGDAVTLGLGNTLSGFNVGTTSGTAVKGTSVGTLSISNVSINTSGTGGNGGGLNLTGVSSPTVSITLGSLTSSGGTNNVKLSGLNGTINLGSSGALSGASSDSFVVNSGAGTVSYGGTVSQSNAARVIDIQNTTGGSVTLSGTVTGGGSTTGVNLNADNGNVSFSILNLGTSGSRITNQAVTITGGSGTKSLGAVSIFTNGVQGIVATNSTGAISSSGGTVNVIGATALNISGASAVSTTPLNMNVTAVSADGGVNGIALTNTSATTPTGGFTVLGDGSMNKNSTGGTLQNQTGNAISLTNVTDVSFNHINIQNTAHNGVKGKGVNNFTFNYGTINNSGGTGPVGTPGDSNIYFGESTYGTSVGGEKNLTGTVSIVGNTLNNAFYHGVHILNYDGTITDLNVSGNSMTSSTSAASSNGTGVHIVDFGTNSTVSNITKGQINNNDFLNFPSQGAIALQVGNATAGGPGGTWGTSGSATNIITIDNNLAAGDPSIKMGTTAILVANAGTGQANVSVSNNGTALKPIANTIGTTIGISVKGNAVLEAAVNNNYVTSNNGLGSNGIALGGASQFGASDVPTLIVTANNNTISNTSGVGLYALMGGCNGKMKVTFQGNNVGPSTGAGNRPAIRVDAGSSATDNTTVCATIGGSTATLKNTGTGVGSFAPYGIGVRKQGIVATTNYFSISGLPGPAPVGSAAVETYLSSQNNGGALVISGDNFENSCPLPLLLAPSLNEIEVPKGIVSLDFDSPIFQTYWSVTSVESTPWMAGDAALTQPQLDSVVSTAKTLWMGAGLTDEQLALLRNITFEVADLPGNYLGEANSTNILVDSDGGGRGWYIGSGPINNTDFSRMVSPTHLYSNPSSVSDSHVDLLTVILHEIGHGMGLDDTYLASDRDNLMYGYLTKGERRLPAQGQALTASNVNKFSAPHFLTLSYAPEHSKSADKGLAGKPVTRTAFRNHSMRSRALTNAALMLPTVTPPVDVLVGSLPTGKSVIVKFQVTVNNSLSPASTTQVSTQGTVLVTGFSNTLTDDPTLGGTSDPTTTPLGRSDLAVTSLTDGVTTINPGSDLTYTISYANHGRAASGVVLTETVPVGTTFKSSGSSAGWSCLNGAAAGTTCTNATGSVPATGVGSTGSKTFIVTVANPVAAGLNSIQNTASIADDGLYEPDVSPADNTASDINTSLNAAPVFGTFTKSDGTTTTTPGSTLTYTINYANTGNQDATGVVLTDTVPVGTMFVPGSSTGGWVETPSSSGIYKLTIGNLAGGGTGSGSATFVVTVNNPAPAGLASIVNNASITDDGTNSPSAITANTSDTDTLNAAPDLTLSKTPDVTNASPGSTIVYTLNYSNTGNQGATGVVITETVPANTTFTTTGSSAGWSCPNNSPANTVCTNSVGTLAGGGASGSKTFAVKLLNSLPGGTTQITNTASIDDDHANGTDPNPGNNSTGNVNTPVDTPPTLGNYSNTTIFVTQGTTVTPSAAPADDHAGFTVGVAISPNTYTGTLSVDPTTGVVTIGDAAPANTYTMTVTVTDSINQTTQRTFQLTVNKSDTTTSITSSLNPSFTNQTVTFTAMVASNTAVTGPPTGTVDFLDGGNPIVGCSGVALSAGQAQCQTNALTVGNHTITATYNGDEAFGTSTGSMAGNPQVINPALSLTVNTTGDAVDANVSDGICDTDLVTAGDQCTLRAALQETNAIASDDTITFSLPANSTISLDGVNGALPAINGNLIITGPGANTLTVQRSNSASSDFRIFTVNSGKTVNISGLTISGGKATGDSGGGILNDHGMLTIDSCVISDNTATFGGGIFNKGDTSGSATLTVTNSTVSSNSATNFGGGINNSGSGGSATVTITGSTISGNTSTGLGGGLENDAATLTLTNSTVSGNNSNTDGGGLFINTGTVTLTNVTVTNNRADNDSNTSGRGGGISDSVAVTLHNTIVAGNFKGGSPSTTADDIFSTVDSASSFNLVGILGGPGGITNGTNNNQVGVVDARLGPLADNGGPTRTHALLAGSPALDVGDDAVTLAPLNLTTDQRGVGFNRKADGPDANSTATVDIGAFEAQVSIEDITDKTTNEDTPLSFQFNTSSGVVNANITATSSNTMLVPNNPANISVTGASTPFTLNITPASNQFGTSTITVTVTVGSQVASDTFVMTVAPIAHTPSVVNSTTLEDTQSGAILVTKNAVDGAEVSHFKVTGITNGTLFYNDGTTQILNNTFVQFSDVGAGLKFTPAANLNSPGSSFSFTIQAATGNVDAALGGGTATSTITVTAVNDAPLFTKGADQTVNEDSGAQTVNNWASAISAGPADETGQTLNFIVTNNNNGLFSVQPEVAANGTLTYTPVANANGTAMVSIQIHDNGGGTDTSAVQTLTITVNAVNDVPSFIQGTDQTVFANSGAQTVNNWATAISAGPADESTQVVDFIVTNNNNGLFSTQPVVSPAGTLTYTPATNTTGTAILSIKVHDNGGILNGGADTSAIQTFNITVNKSGTTTALGSSPSPSFTNQTVTFTATVTSSTVVTGPPTGTVTFREGVNPICSNVSLAAGQAQCQTSALTPGGSSHSITADYNGDGAFNGSTSNSVSQTVNPLLSLTVNTIGDAADANVGDAICDTDLGTSGNQCTLRAALQETNAIPSDDTIGFSLPANSTITLSTALPNINGNLVINGPGANTLTVQRSTAGGTPVFRIFTINSGKVVTISGLTVSNGDGGIFNNGGTLNLNNSTISGNSASSSGGGIFNIGTLNLNNSTISGNSASSSGGGIFNIGGGGGAATLTINNSTISGNSSDGSGGGIDSFAQSGGTATLTIHNSTISSNSTFNNASGGGIVTGGTGVTAKLSNTIVAGNFKNSGGSTFPDDLFGIVDPTSSFNLIGTDGSGGLTNGINNNLVGVADARLAPLAFNGGTTQTHALLPGSLALDAGSNTLANNAGLNTDQRGTGFNRFADSPDADAIAMVDIGAFEAQPSIEDIPDKTTNEDTALPTFNFAVSDGGVSGFTVTATSNNQTLVPNGNITLGGAGSTRTLSITPAANQFGTAAISVTVSGTIGSTQVSMTDTFTLTVNSVNDAPTLDAISNLTINEDAGAQAVNFTGISAGGESQALIVTATSNNTGLILNPTVNYTSPNATGSLSLTPVANQSGSAIITVTINDGGGTANGGVDTVVRTFTVTVNAVNDAPVNTVPSTQNAIRNNDLTFSAANSNLISISDVDAGAAAVKVTLTATNGKLTLSSTSGLAFSVGTGTQNATMTFTGTITNINAALNGLIFSPTPGYDGPASVQITTDDQGNTGSGGAQTDTDTISINVNKGGSIVFSSATYNAGEGSGTVTITVNRAGGSFGTTKVDYATSNGTAIAGSDYTASSGTLTFANGETTKTFTVPILEDALNEAPETVNLTLSNAQGSGDIGAQSTATLTINDNDPPPSLSINDVSVTEGNSGTVNAVFTVTLSAISGQTVTVNYQTANGTATAPSDYTAIPSTLLTFASGETTKTITVSVKGDTLAEIDETFFINLSGSTNATVSDNQGVGTIVSDDTPVVQFSSATYNVAEDGLHATITVNRLGDISKVAQVDYATSDPSGLKNCSDVAGNPGNASSRCDYATSVGTLRFAAGEGTKIVSIPIVNDVYVEGPEAFTITLSNSMGAELGSPSSAVVTIDDNDNGEVANPINDNAFFIRQLYIDFLGREPDPVGFQGWLTQLNNCAQDDQSCDRIHIAEGFARSEEFAARGYFIYRAYHTALGRKPDYREFIPDMAKVSGFLNAQELEANKQAFVNEFVTRNEFRMKYDSLDNAGYVNSLEATALVSVPGKQGLLDDLNAGRKTRAEVLRAIMETEELKAKYVNEAFVVMEYFGFLRRDPDAAYQGWIDQFNHSNSYRLVIGGFVNSTEYSIRFGQ
jgi:hypothetical protein